MKSLYENDLESILSLGDFDTTATVTIPGGKPLCINGIFTDATQQTSIVTGEVETVNPSFACQSSKIGSVKRGCSIEIDEVTYTIERIERLGTGVSLVHLKT